MHESMKKKYKILHKIIQEAEIQYNLYLYIHTHMEIQRIKIYNREYK